MSTRRDTGPTEAVLSGLLAASPDALLAIDETGSIVFVNDQVERLFGWSRSDLVGRPVEQLVPERFTANHPTLRDSYLAQPSTRPMGAGLELWARRRDGSEFPAEISLSGFKTPDGTLVAAAIRDVTEARRAEQRYRAVLASAPDAIVGVNAAGRIDIVNAQAERLFGWTADELIGQQVERLVPLTALDVHVARRDGYVADPQSRPMGAGLQLSARRKDDTTFPAEISLSTVTDDLGDLLVLAAVRDVSDRIELEAERQRQALDAQREQSHRLESLGQLAGGVAHDFNNLLGVILNYNTLLTRQVTDPGVLADLGEIRAAAERAAGLTRQLLTFARRDIANPEPLEVNEIVRGVATMLDRTLGEDIELVLELADGPVVAVADRHQIEQIVVNLVINARDAMSDGGRVTIETDQSPGPSGSGDAGSAVLRVSDSGHGMTPEVAARAFEPFFTTKAMGEGTGLGLATVYGIVRQSRGEVSIRSAPGEGTTITVVLRGATDARPSDGAEVAVAGGGHERLLLVEDEPSLRVATARLLAAKGYDVVVAADGLEAIDVFDQESGAIDLVITDVAMPRMRGDELARLLAERKPGLQVIFMSGYDSGDAPLTGRLLAKPVSEEALLGAVREVLDERPDGRP
jgi:PAS domain S-box-containing protein